MLSFAVYSNGKPAEKVNLAGVYVVGSDDVPLRAEVSFKNGVILCKKRAAGPAGLALLWNVKSVGRILLETGRVLERKQPYILQVELARGRLTRITQKCEEWGLYDYQGCEDLLRQVDKARDRLVNALQADTPTEAAAIAEDSLDYAVQASEALTRFHATALLGRRKQSSGLPKRIFGCSVNLDKPSDLKRQRLAGAVDFVTLPIVWKDIEPSEQTFNWKPLDAWVELLSKNRIPMKGSALVCFREGHVPDWLYIWEHDFDTIRDLAFEHARRVVNRYGQYIQAWDVISGVHANNCFTFTFEQLMELTRMSAALAKQTSARAAAIIDLVEPWGEYYARNQRTIPPLLYADMVAQSGAIFDAFGLRLGFGPGVDGMFVRDTFQISSMLDQFAKLGKPLHVTAVQVPSDPPRAKTAGGADVTATDGGTWRQPWNEQTQAEWLRQFVQIALSRPFVDAVSWHGLNDPCGDPMPSGGLLTADLTPKAAYHELVKLRAELGAAPRGGAAEAAI